VIPVAFWAAVQIHSQRERLAIRYLSLAGFEVWFPRIRKRRIIRGRRQEVTLALFPSCWSSFSGAPRDIARASSGS